MTICELPRLKRLLAPTNKISALPAEFDKLTSLLELDLSDNSFREFPNILLKLPQMQIIRMAANSPGIRHLPLTLPIMRSLTLLDLDKNPIVNEKPPEALRTMYSLNVVGIPLSSAKTSSVKWNISEAEEEELAKLLASKAEGAKRRIAERKKIIL